MTVYLHRDQSIELNFNSGIEGVSHDPPCKIKIIKFKLILSVDSFKKDGKIL